MIFRIAASEQDVERALVMHYAAEPNADPSEKDVVLPHWMVMQATSPEGFWIAEDEVTQQIVGIASAIRRPPMWILNNYYVHPAYQGKGIGRELLTRAISTREGCDHFMVHASSNPSAQSLYLKFGLHPLPYSILFKGNPSPARDPSGLGVEKCAATEIFPTLDALDRKALGFTRQVDHQRWGDQGLYFLVEKDGQTGAYFRVAAECIIGPLVVSDESWMPAVLDLAIIQQQAISTGPHYLFVPGANRAAIAQLCSRGYRFHELNLLMSSHPMPGLAQAVFHDMDFF